jgi:uncharacterized membrane protein
MEKERLAAFSDGVIAIILTIMVLELKPPAADDWASLFAFLPAFFSYVLSFIYVAIYWNNHHHMLHLVRHVNGGILWANMHLLFWLSLFPLTTEWLRLHPVASVPAAVYGLVMLMAALAYYILQKTIIRAQGAESVLQKALGRDLKGKISPALYTAAIVLAFVSPYWSYTLYVGVALMWLVPDRRIENSVSHKA